MKLALTILAVLAAAGALYFAAVPTHRSGAEFGLSWFALGLYLLSFIGFLVAFLKRRRGDSYAGNILLGTAIVVHLLAVIVRGHAAGHLPFASRFEALLFYAFATTLLVCLLSLLRRDLPVAFLSLPIVLVFMIGALIGGDKAPKPLPPVLHSPFFSIHVIIAFFGYAFYTVNLGLAVGGLFARPGPVTPARLMVPGSGLSVPGTKNQELRTKLGTPLELLGLARNLVPWGLLLLGSGIGLGGIWAMFSWGNWWGWDPKENAALVTWLGYLAFLHAPAWQREPRKSDAVYLIAGYVLLIVTFLGVNLLKRGLHAYQ